MTYNGNPHTATVSTITGVNGETGATVGAVNVTKTTHTDAGTYNSDAWSFTGTANYNNQSGTVNDNIGKADATFTVTAYSVTYNGNPHTATVSTITGVNGETGATVGAVNVTERYTPTPARTTAMRGASPARPTTTTRAERLTITSARRTRRLRSRLTA